MIEANFLNRHSFYDHGKDLFKLLTTERNLIDD